MMMGLSDLGNAISAKPGGLQEGAVMQGIGMGQSLPGRLLGGRRRMCLLCRTLAAPGWCPAGPPVLLAECASLSLPSKGPGVRAEYPLSMFSSIYFSALK